MDKYYKPEHMQKEILQTKMTENLAEGDMLITMGAGDVVKIGEELLASEK